MNEQHYCRAFHHYSRAWYGRYDMLGRNITDQVMFGVYSRQGGTTGEMAMRWHDLGGGTVSPRLEVFDDAWHLLAVSFLDVVQALGSYACQDITPEQFCAILTSLGFEDWTETEAPVDVRHA